VFLGARRQSHVLAELTRARAWAQRRYGGGGVNGDTRRHCSKARASCQSPPLAASESMAAASHCSCAASCHDVCGVRALSPATAPAQRRSAAKSTSAVTSAMPGSSSTCTCDAKHSARARGSAERWQHTRASGRRGCCDTTARPWPLRARRSTLCRLRLCDRQDAVISLAPAKGVCSLGDTYINRRAACMTCSARLKQWHLLRALTRGAAHLLVCPEGAHGVALRVVLAVVNEECAAAVLRDARRRLRPTQWRTHASHVSVLLQRCVGGATLSASLLPGL
jgi:hypothetical protein